MDILLSGAFLLAWSRSGQHMASYPCWPAGCGWSRDCVRSRTRPAAAAAGRGPAVRVCYSPVLPTRPGSQWPSWPHRGPGCPAASYWPAGRRAGRGWWSCRWQYCAAWCTMCPPCRLTNQYRRPVESQPPAGEASQARVQPANTQPITIHNPFVTNSKSNIPPTKPRTYERWIHRYKGKFEYNTRTQ